MNHCFDGFHLRHLDITLADGNAHTVITGLIAPTGLEAREACFLLEEFIERRVQMSQGFLQGHTVVICHPSILLTLLSNGKELFQVMDRMKIDTLYLIVMFLEFQTFVVAKAHRTEKTGQIVLLVARLLTLLY